MRVNRRVRGRSFRLLTAERSCSSTRAAEAALQLASAFSSLTTVHLKCGCLPTGAAKAVWRPDLYDAALPGADNDLAGEPAAGIGTFAGPPFDPDGIGGHLRAWNIRR